MQVSKNTKFVNMLVKNIQYFNKDIVSKQILAFLMKQDSFNPQQAVRNSGDDSFFSFIELIGFVSVGKNLVKMCIGIPKNYPQAPPIFLINFGRNIHLITQEAQLLRDGLIDLEKNELNEDYIRFKFPYLNKHWDCKKTLLEAFDQLIYHINNPPLLKEINQDKVIKKKNNFDMSSKKDKIGESEGQELIDKLNIEISDINNDYATTIAQRENLDYYKSRNILLKKYVPTVFHAIQKKKSYILAQDQQLKNTLQTSKLLNKCEDLLEMSENDRRKLQLMSKQDALKDCEKKIKKKIDQKESYTDYKKMIKYMYDDMFRVQTELLCLQ